MAIPTGFGGRDYPDFGGSTSTTRQANITDLSELAVRLGSLSWFDRLGNVLITEGFEYGLGNWQPNAYPANAYPVLSAKYFAKEPYSAKLITTIDAGSYSGMKRYFPFPYVAQFGVEVHFKPVETFDTLYWWMTFYTGKRRYHVQVIIAYSDNELQLRTTTSLTDKIDDLDVQIGINSPFHVLKVTADLANENYARLMLDERDYDVSDKGIVNTVSTISPYLSMLFYLKPIANTVNRIWLDNIIFTINEPGV